MKFELKSRLRAAFLLAARKVRTSAVVHKADVLKASPNVRFWE